MIIRSMMSQKSILSFFESTEQTNAKDSKRKCVVVEDSPKSKKKRKIQCIENDDESSEISTKKSIDGCSKISGSSCHKKDFSNEGSKKKRKVIESNGFISPGKTFKQKNIEDADETAESSHSSMKCEKDSSSHNEDSNKERNGNVDLPAEIVEKSLILNENGIVFIPKRKTARKQMNSARIIKTDMKQFRIESDSEPIDKGITNKEVLKEIDEEEEMECEVDFENDNLSVREKQENVAKKEKSAGIKKLQKKQGDKPIDKKTTSKKKIEPEESIECEAKVENDTLSLTETQETIVKDEKSPNIKKQKKKQENKEKSAIVKKPKKKQENDEKSAIVKKADNKQKANATNKDSPLNRPNIQSFFTPIKTVKEKSKTETEDNKRSLHLENGDSPIKTVIKQAEAKPSPIKKISNEIEKDDSPVKKIQKKKIQCLESDDESDGTTSTDLSPKKEADDTSVISSVNSPEKKESSVKKGEKHFDNSSTEIKDCSSAKKESVIEMKEEKVSDIATLGVTTSSSKVSTSENAKLDKEKKFAVKSTAVDTVYDPSKTNYHPINDAFWKRNEKVPYLALAKTLELIENTSGRLKTIEILSNFFRSVIVLSPDDFLHSVYLCLNRVAPEYEGIEMGVGETLLMKAVAQATGRTVDKIKAEVAIKGDLGLVSESSRGNQRVMFTPPKLTISAVFNKFLEIAKMSGNAAMAKKTDKIKVLFVACRDCEAKYIIRSLSGKLRIGLAEQSILSAIARAAVLTPPNQEYPPKKIDASKGKSPSSFKEFLDSQTLVLKTAYCECPNYDLIIPILLKEGISVLPDRCQLSPGVPLKPMLAHPTSGVDIVLARFDKNPFTCEFKYDGERAQIHMNDKGEMRIFSRNQEDNTSKYPDIISWLTKSIKETTKSFILDSEAVAFDREKKQILPFQVLSTRKRKDAVESEIVVQVCVMAFDLLYLNGKSLVKMSLEERRKLLHSSFNEIENKFMFAQYKDGDDAETMQDFLDESVKSSCEGLMIKALKGESASYEIAKRSHNWLKLKKDYLQSVGDTLDLVVIGGYYGKGKRTGNYGGFLLACYDEENEEFQSICKLGTGFKDDNLEAHTKFLKQHIIEEAKPYFRYDHSLEPDVWFEPVQVWEIKCADLSISPVHRAAIGIVDPSKGISLRFPRFIRIRDDKSVEDATNSTQIADMYRNQQQIQNTANKNSNVEEDYY